MLENDDSNSGNSEHNYDANGNLVQLDWFSASFEVWFIDLFLLRAIRKAHIQLPAVYAAIFSEKKRLPVY